jgi:hypothetical protein
MKHLQHTSKTYETLEIYVCNMKFQRNIFLLLGNGGSLARGVHRCRAIRWRGARCSGGEGRAGPVEKGAAGPSTREGRGSVGSVVDREEDGLPCSGSEKMSVGGAEPR